MRELGRQSDEEEPTVVVAGRFPKAASLASVAQATQTLTTPELEGEGVVQECVAWSAAQPPPPAPLQHLPQELSSSPEPPSPKDQRRLICAQAAVLKKELSAYENMDHLMLPSDLLHQLHHEAGLSPLGPGRTTPV